MIGGFGMLWMKYFVVFGWLIDMSMTQTAIVTCNYVDTTICQCNFPSIGTTSGTIVSRKPGITYPDYANCDWRITSSDPNTKIKMRFTQFALPGSPPANDNNFAVIRQAIETIYTRVKAINCVSPGTNCRQVQLSNNSIVNIDALTYTAIGVGILYFQTNPSGVTYDGFIFQWNLVVPCVPGTTGLDGECTNCVSGKYKTSSGSVVCTGCGVGTYSTTVGASTSSTCLSCPAGSSSVQSSSVCSCNPGFEGPDGGPCTACKAGWWKSDSGPGTGYSYIVNGEVVWLGCGQCLDGTYSATVGASAASACLACPAYSYSWYESKIITSCICNLGYTGPDGGPCTACAAGKYKDTDRMELIYPPNRNTLCTNCGVGTYSGTLAATASSACLTCPVGSNSVTGTSSVNGCVVPACAAGSTGQDGGVCTSCVAGKYKTTSGSVACTDCGVGTYSATVGASAASVCLTCPSNSNAPTSSSAVGSCSCNVGYTGSNGGVCTGCVAGKYKSVSGSATCSDCSAGTYSVTIAATALSNCIACPASSNSAVSSTSCTCNAGYSGPDTGVCSACVAGKYKTNAGSVACTDCGVASYSATVGASALSTCLSCPLNSNAPISSSVSASCSCNVGYTGANGGTCSACVAGKYKDVSGSGACLDCAGGTYSLTVGATASATCVSCPLNSNSVASSSVIAACTCNAGFTGPDGGVCSTCVAGKYKTTSGSVACTGCGVGTYSTTVGASTSSVCLTCPANSNSVASSSVIAACTCNAGFTGTDGGVCSTCVAGKYKTSSGSVACTDCGVGLYSVAVGATTSSTCISCPVNTNSAASSSAIGGCVCNAGFTGPDGGVCSACVAGKYKTSSGSVVCTDCGVGLYSVAVGATASAVCVSCPANSYSGVSSSVITACTCNAGFTGANGGTCTACVAGKYKDVSGSVGCFDCSAGSYLTTFGATASGACVACPANSYSVAVGASASGTCTCNTGYTGPDGGVCSACLPGSFKAQTGSAACELCPNNTFSVDTGRSSSCVPCQANSVSAPGSASQDYCYCKIGYAHAVGMSTCRICDPGTYNSQLGRTACSNCSVGLYSVNYGAIGSETCLSCPLGQWSPEGSPNCNLCPANSRAAAGSGSRTNCICDAGYTGPAGSTCVSCVTGTYKAATGSASCSACPALTSTSGAAVSLSDCWCVTGYIKVSGACVTMVPRAIAVEGSLTGVSANSSAAYIENATQALRASIALRLNISIDLVTIARLLNSTEVRVSIFGRSETDLDMIEGQLQPGITGLDDAQTSVLQGQMVQGQFVECPANYKVYNATCQCAPGHMLQSDLSTCTACAAGKWSAGTGSTSCADCPTNTFSTGASTACTSCHVNSVSSAGSASVDACSCNPGYFFFLTSFEKRACLPCAAGSYKNGVGNFNCSVCSLSKVENQVCCPAQSTMQLTPSAFSLLYERSRPKFHYSGSHWDAVNSRFLDVSGNGRHSLSGYTCDGWGNVGPTPIVAENTRGLVQADITGVLPYGHVKVPAVTCPDGQCLVHMYSVWECVGQTLWVEDGMCTVLDTTIGDNGYGLYVPDETCGAKADRTSGGRIKTQQRTATLRGWNPGIGEYWPKWTMCYAARIMPVFNPESGQFDWYDNMRFIQSSARGHFGIDNTVISSYVYGWIVYPVAHDNTQWTVFCIKSEPGADPSKQALLDGVGVCSGPRNIPYDHALSIGNSLTTNPWQLAQMIVWDVLLSDADMQAVSDKLMAHVREGELMPSGCGTASALSCGDNRCICNRGYTGPENGPCGACETGKYKNTTTTEPCGACAAGSFSDVNGSMTCMPCPTNTYSGTGARQCTECPNLTQSVIGSNSSGACQCVAGYTGPGGLQPCTPCVAGTYKTVAGSGACSACPARTFSGALGASSIAACTSCHPNATSAAGSPSEEYCYCEAGFAQVNGTDWCALCNPGKYNTQLARTACSNCTVGLYAAGFGSKGVDSCLLCPAGKWSPEGSPDCNMCPVNAVAPALSGSTAQCICNAGFTGPTGGPCVACEAGKYKTVNGSAACISCAFGSDSLPGLTFCTCTERFFTNGSVCWPKDASTNSLTTELVSSCYNYNLQKPVDWLGGQFIWPVWQQQCLMSGSQHMVTRYMQQHPTLAFDGLITNWGFVGQANVAQQEWQVDFARVVQIETVSIWYGVKQWVNNGLDEYYFDGIDWVPVRLAWRDAFTISISNSTSNFVSCAVNQFGPLGPEASTHSCIGSARYLRIKTTSTKTLQLQQVQAFSPAVQAVQCNVGYGGPTGGPCVPCPMGSYQAATGLPCASCPSNSYSYSLASTSRTQCVCNVGYVPSSLVNLARECTIDGAPHSKCRTLSWPQFTFYINDDITTFAGGAMAYTEAPVWMIIDLQRQVNVSAFSLYSYNDMINNFYVYVSNTQRPNKIDYTPFKWGDENTLTDGAQHCAARVSRGTAASSYGRCQPAQYLFANTVALYACTCGAPAVGRYLHVWVAGTNPNYIAITELQVWGRAVNETLSRCEACPPGTYWIQTGTSAFGFSGECRVCSNNTFSGASAATTCTTCPAGFNSFLGATAIEDCCVPNSTSIKGMNCPCDAGFSGTGRSDCTPCAPGTYKNEVMSSSCSLCPANTYSTAVQATRNSTCVSCPMNSLAVPGSTQCLCAAGYTGEMTVCTACVPGKYKRVPGTSACITCPANTVAVGAATTVCSSVAGFSGLGYALEDVARSCGSALNETCKTLSNGATSNAGGVIDGGLDGNVNTFVSVAFNPNLARSCGSTGTAACLANSGPVGQGAASLAVDGDINTASATEYGTARLPYFTPYWSVDFGQSRSVFAVKILVLIAYGSDGWTYLKDFKITVGDSPVWSAADGKTPVNTVCADYLNGAGRSYLTFTCEDTVRGRYLHVVGGPHVQNYVMLSEVVVESFNYTTAPALMQPWWAVDFEVERGVGGVVIQTQVSSAVQVRVGHSTDPLENALCNNSTMLVGVNNTLTCATAMTGRYLFVIGPGNSVLTLNEVRVLGAAAAPCSAGTYKSLAGNVNCTACPAFATSIVGATANSQCRCSDLYVEV